MEISDVVLRNSRGRPLCKVVDCGKTEQAHNDGFCRTHFNQFVVDDADNAGVDGLKDPWTCSCGKQWPQMQKRCGSAKCQKVIASLFFSNRSQCTCIINLISYFSVLLVAVERRKA